VKVRVVVRCVVCLVGAMSCMSYCRRADLLRSLLQSVLVEVCVMVRCVVSLVGAMFVLL